MTIVNMGSINIDTVFRVGRMPAWGETLAAHGISVGLGGKGLNQSVAIARAGGTVAHLGCIGRQDAALRTRIEGFGVECSHLHLTETPTGQAAIMVDAHGENAIVLAQGANGAITPAMIASALTGRDMGDWVLVQNETNAVEQMVRAARSAGLRVALSPAPFEAQVVLPLLDQVDLICLNEIELAQLHAAGGVVPQEVLCVVTLGARGAQVLHHGRVVQVPAHQVDVVDTTGAGDTFLGYFLAGMDGGMALEQCLSRAIAASALQVTRLGAAEVIPHLAELADQR